MGARGWTIAGCGLAGLALLWVVTPARGGEVKAVPKEPHVESGFHMEGAAEIDIVFGDIEAYKAHIDRFYDLDAELARTRTGFKSDLHAAIDALSAKGWGCPTDALAVPYFRATEAGVHFKTLGSRLEQSFYAIRQLDTLGETAGLTPDYRWRVNKVRSIYRDALRDYEEMRFALWDQLYPYVVYRGCSTWKLLERGKKGIVPEPEPVAGAGDDDGDGDASDDAPPRTESEPLGAAAATFFVDNRGCDGALEVWVDGAEIGRVAARAKGAFQGTNGRHALCLVPHGSGQVCGQRGTVRNAYLHDGWSITMHCATRQSGES